MIKKHSIEWENEQFNPSMELLEVEADWQIEDYGNGVSPKHDFQVTLKDFEILNKEKFSDSEIHVAKDFLWDYFYDNEIPAKWEVESSDFEKDF